VARGEKEILEAAKEIRKRAVRGIGQAMEAQREAGLMSKGAAAPGNANWQRQRGSESDPRCENERDEPKTITLAEAGIDKHLADKARKFAACGGRENAPLAETSGASRNTEDCRCVERQ
jgi:hypothetical protein